VAASENENIPQITRERTGPRGRTQKKILNVHRTQERGKKDPLKVWEDRAKNEGPAPVGEKRTTESSGKPKSKDGERVGIW